VRRKKPYSSPNIHESFSDVALLMLATFIFLLVTILITSKMAEEYQLPRLKKEVAELQEKLRQAGKDKDRLSKELGSMAGMSTDAQVNQVLESLSLAKGTGRRDFDIFIKGLKSVPGRDLHMVIDATGSMHGVSDFIIPLLRVIVLRSGKHLDAITWFSDEQAETYSGSMGDMFDKLMAGAPFVGATETIGDAFIKAKEAARTPGAYILLGDEPSDDKIHYKEIPAPVFTLPIGRENQTTLWEYRTLAEKTGGKMLSLSLH